MKVLYIGNYRDGTGWGNACIGNMLAMDSVGIDVVPRAISFEQMDKPYPERIKELEQKFCKKKALLQLFMVDLLKITPLMANFDETSKTG